jgi:glycerophosphoryl diester phosphodiesterase
MHLYAHRGNSCEAPENTLAAFRAAAAAGVDGVEFDVQMSRDGVPVVIHDESLERTTDGKGRVGEQSAADLARLDAGRWFGPAFAGEPLPTLDQVLEIFRGTPLRVNVELKTGRVPYPGLVERVIRAVERLDLRQQVLCSSFNHYSLKEARERAPWLECAALIYENLIDPWEYVRRHGFQALHPHHALVDESFMAACAGAGIPVRVWTVDDPARAARLKALGVAAIITNRPRELAAALAPARA